MKTAIISGVTGQDGAYLSRYLVGKGYKVVGLVRSLDSANTSRLKYLGILEQISITECDLHDLSQIINIITAEKPDEIYNLAAQSSVSLSFQQPIGTLQFNINSVINILEAIRLLKKSIRFYQASSSEMYGSVEKLPITEESKFHPLSPYAISKVAAHHITINYRESYDLFACCGILFNHESFLRGEHFFVKKVIKAALDIKKGRRDFIELGNLNVKRDFGLSEKYVEVMWLMLQQEIPRDFVICSGVSISLREIADYVFNKVGVNTDKIVISGKLFRPTDIIDIYGSSDKAKKELGWNYDLKFLKVLDMIVEEEMLNDE